MCNNTLARTRNVIEYVHVNNHFLEEIILLLKAIKSHFKGSYDKQNLTLVVISYEIYETRPRLVSQISYEMTTRVRSSISALLLQFQLFHKIYRQGFDRNEYKYAVH